MESSLSSSPRHDEFCQKVAEGLVPFQIMREIAEHKIKIYEFPETDDEEENRLVKKIKVAYVAWQDETLI